MIFLLAIMHILHIKSGSQFFKNGSTYDLYGTWPTTHAILSLVTSGPVQANNFSNDRNIGGRCANGDLAELIIFNHALSPIEVQMMEGYLAHKMGTYL